MKAGYDDYRCLHCGRRFRQDEMLEWRSFEGVKRQSCPGCTSQDFILLDNLTR